MSAPVYLVRHGQSEWNVLRLTQGQTAHPRLTDLGRQQAHTSAALISDALGAGDVAEVRVLSSDLVRALETAEVIAEALGAEVVTDPRLREQHLGDLEGRSYEETWAAAEEHDWSDPALPIAGGESLLAVRERMVACLQELDPDVCHVVVSHGDAIRTALSHVKGEAAHRAEWVDVPNGSVACLGSEIVWLGVADKTGG